jgi:hypothetical protein
MIDDARVYSPYTYQSKKAPPEQEGLVSYW